MLVGMGCLFPTRNGLVKMAVDGLKIFKMDRCIIKMVPKFLL